MAVDIRPPPNLVLVALGVAMVEAIRALTAGRSTRWLIVLIAGLVGTAILRLWWSHLRFPLVQPVG